MMENDYLAKGPLCDLQISPFYTMIGNCQSIRSALLDEYTALFKLDHSQS